MKNLVLTAIVMGCVFLSGCASQYEILTLQNQVKKYQTQLDEQEKQLEAQRLAILSLESSLQEYDTKTQDLFQKFFEGALLIAEQVDKNVEDMDTTKETLASIAEILDMSRKITEVFDERQKELTEKVDRIIEQLSGERL